MHSFDLLYQKAFLRDLTTIIGDWTRVLEIFTLLYVTVHSFQNTGVNTKNYENKLAQKIDIRSLSLIHSHASTHLSRQGRNWYSASGCNYPPLSLCFPGSNCVCL